MSLRPGISFGRHRSTLFLMAEENTKVAAYQQKCNFTAKTFGPLLLLVRFVRLAFPV